MRTSKEQKVSQRLAAPVLEVLYLSPLEQAPVILDLKYIKTLMYPVPPEMRTHCLYSLYSKSLQRGMLMQCLQKVSIFMKRTPVPRDTCELRWG